MPLEGDRHQIWQIILESLGLFLYNLFKLFHLVFYTQPVQYQYQKQPKISIFHNLSCLLFSHWKPLEGTGATYILENLIHTFNLEAAGGCSCCRCCRCSCSPAVAACWCRDVLRNSIIWMDRTPSIEEWLVSLPCFKCEDETWRWQHQHVFKT